MTTLITTYVAREVGGRPVSRSANLIAHLIPLTVLPAGVWRIFLGFGVPMGFARAALERDDMPGWGTVSTIVLSVLTECLALLSLGLVRQWGEVVPSWVPGLAGRRIPRLAVVIPAAVGGVLLTVMWSWAVLGLFNGRVEHFTGGVGWRALLLGCYLPTVLWGPLLLVLTLLYDRRRRAA